MATTIETTGPLGTDVLASCAGLDPALSIHRPIAGDRGWVTAADLIGDERTLVAVLDAIHRRWQTPDRRVDAAFLTNAYAWYLGVAAVTPYLVAGEVLGVAPDNLVMHLDPDGGLDGVGLRTLEPVRPSGLAADAVRDGLETHLAAYVDALLRVSPIGHRAAWAVAGDAMAATFLFVGERLGRVEAATLAARAILDAPGSSIRWRGRFVQVETPGGPACRQERASCCLSYRLAGEETCGSCPLRVGRQGSHDAPGQADSAPTSRSRVMSVANTRTTAPPAARRPS